MMARFQQVMRLRFWPFFILPNLLFAAVAMSTDAGWLIGILNSLLISLAAGVCCAYGPAAIRILFTHDPIEDSDCLSLGIFISWGAIIELRAWSVVWRWMGMPAALTNTDFITYGLFMSATAAVLHLGAPGGVNGRIPTTRWIKIGILVAAVVLLTILVSWSLTTADLFDRLTVVVSR
jgi:hypothetical protein